MGLESGTYVTDLVSTNPVSSDEASRGDDHIRLIKTVLANSLPNLDRAFYIPKGVAAKTGAYSVVAADQNKTIPADASGGAFTITLPDMSITSIDGYMVRILKIDASLNAVTIDGNSSDTINGSATITLTKKWEFVVLFWDDATSSWFAMRAADPKPFPTGGTIPYFGSSLPDSTWLYCNGETIGNTGSGADNAGPQYQELFEQIKGLTELGNAGTESWTGLSTVLLPDLRGRTIFGQDQMNAAAAATRIDAEVTNEDAIGETFGAQNVVLTIAELPVLALGDYMNDPGHVHTNLDGASNNAGYSAGATTAAVKSTEAVESATTGITWDSFGTDEAHNNLPPGMIAPWIIKV